MKTHKFFLILFILSYNGSFCQNIVPNGGFEENFSDTCGQVAGFYTYLSNSTNINNWFSPNPYFGVTEIFSSRFKKSCVSYKPKDKILEGEFCAGICNDDNFGSRRGYLQIKLLKSLVKGKLYYLSFWVIPSKRFQGEITQFSSNNLGLLFSETLVVDSKSFRDGEYFEDLALNCEKIIVDTVKWTRVKGKFKAKANYNYLHIGNFAPFGKTKSIPISKMNGILQGSFFLIDNVYIGEKPQIKRKNKKREFHHSPTFKSNNRRMELYNKS
jgi:hypothetical protein